MDLEATRYSLIERLPNQDDIEAWDEFVSLYGPIVFRVALARGLQATDAEDLVQDVLLAVAGSVEKWLSRTDRSRFRYWLLAITRNEAVNQLARRAQHGLVLNGPQAELALGNVADPAALSNQIAMEHERFLFHWAAERVRHSLAEHTWQAFWLTAVLGHSIEEVAAQLQMRPANIYIARSRIMTRIKELVRQYPPDASEG